ncbi:hypothetical protein DPMN_108414 [Dreissena polymorpha]|uniref:Uncharacterized protein n=1 Tax=Dreissena polymorpha TaxID=45954 RepID=A0A9D4K8T2_DREPO|nr:hypothetical protein DPMN_108414 [Dreissena polymorpha]
MSLLSNDGPRRLATARETKASRKRKQAKKRNTFVSSGTVPSGILPAYRECRPCRYMEIEVTDRFSAESRPSGATACSAGRPRSKGETNGPHGSRGRQSGDQASRAQLPDYARETDPTICESRLQPPLPALRDNQPSVQASRARLPGHRDEARKTTHTVEELFI